MEWRQKRVAFVDWLTNTLRLDVRFYGKSFSWLSLGHMSGVIRGVATTFLMARWLVPETLGQFRYIIAIFGIAGIFSLTGMNTSVIRGIAKGDTVMARYALRRILQFAPLGTLTLIIAAFERYIHNEPTVAIALFISAIIFIPYSISGLYGPILTGQEKIKELSRIAIMNNLFFAMAFVVILFASKQLIIITLAYFGFDILLRGFLTWREFKRLPEKGSIKEHASLGYHMSGIGMMQTVALHINQILLQRFWGYSTLASFSVATVIPEQIKYAVNNIGGTFLQRLSRHGKSEKLLKATRRHYWIGIIAAVVIVVLYALAAPFLIPWLFPNYPNAVNLSIVYALGLIGLPVIVGQYFMQAHNEIKKLWRYFASNTALQLITSIVLTPIFGIWGAVWAKVITRIASLPIGYPSLTVKLLPQKQEEDTES